MYSFRFHCSFVKNNNAVPHLSCCQYSKCVDRSHFSYDSKTQYDPNEKKKAEPHLTTHTHTHKKCTFPAAHITHVYRQTKSRVWGSLIYRSLTFMASWKAPPHHRKIALVGNLPVLPGFLWYDLICSGIFVIKNLTVGIRTHKQNNSNRKPCIQKKSVYTNSLRQSECIMRHSMSGQITLSDGCILFVYGLHSITFTFFLFFCRSE